MYASTKSIVRSALKWSETYTKTDMLYATHGGVWLFLAKIVGFMSSLALATAMANLISPDAFGMYKFILSAAGIIGALSLTGAATAIVQAVARGYEGALISCTKNYLRWSAGSILIAVGAAVYYLLNGNGVLCLSMLVVALCNPLFVASSFFGSFLSGKKNFRAQSVFDGIADILPAGLLIATLFFVQNPVLLVAVYFISGISVNAGLYFLTLQIYKPTESTDPATDSYAKHLSLIGVLGKIGENIDKVLVFHFVGAAPLAIYAFAQTPIAQLKLLNDIPVKLAFPKLSERDFAELQRSLPRKVLALMLLMAGIALAYILAAPYLFAFLFPAYLSSVPVTQVLALSLILVPGSLFSDALSAHMKKKELYISQTILPITKIALFLVLLPLYGMWGAVATILIWQCLTCIVFAWLFWSARATSIPT